MIEKKNKIRLEREQVAGFEADEEMPLSAQIVKPMAKPAGTGKKKRKKLPAVNVEVWSTKPD